MFLPLINLSHTILAASSDEALDILSGLGPELATIKTKPFIIENNAGDIPHSFNPYTQFDTIVTFLSVIPNTEKPTLSAIMKDIKSLEELASTATDYRNYDEKSALFYNADCCTGIDDLVYDSHFIEYFLVRFYYFVEAGFVSEYGFILDDNFRKRKDHTPIDLLRLPSSLEDTHFDSETEALCIFNDIIADTTLTDAVVSFIKAMLIQLSLVTRSTSRDLTTTTRDFYAYTLEKYLQKTKNIVVQNYERKIRFVENTKMLSFVMLKAPNEHSFYSHVTSQVELNSMFSKQRIVKNID